MNRNLFLVLSLAALAAGCSSVSTGSDYDESVRFGEYGSFAWVPPHPDKLIYPMERNSILDRRIRGAVESVLEEKGYARETKEPDVLLGYFIKLQEKVDVTSWGYGYRGHSWHGGGVDVRTWTEGTLVLDVIDAKSKEVVWRGWAIGAVRSPSSPSPEEVRETIAKVLAEYPPRP
jgi:hypothetical protein